MSHIDVSHSYVVPEPFHWDESFKVFYDNLDGEHQGLFKGIFRVELAADRTDVPLKHLVSVMTDHFKSEEKMMKDAEFTGLDHHKKEHDEFIEHLKEWKASDINDEKLIFAKNWLVKHIKAVDSKYSGKLH